MRKKSTIWIQKDLLDKKIFYHFLSSISTTIFLCVKKTSIPNSFCFTAQTIKTRMWFLYEFTNGPVVTVLLQLV